MRSDAEKRWSVHIMVDCGYHRDGVDPAEEESVKLAKAISCGEARRRCVQRSWLQARPDAEAASLLIFRRPRSEEYTRMRGIRTIPRGRRTW